MNKELILLFFILVKKVTPQFVCISKSCYRKGALLKRKQDGLFFRLADPGSGVFLTPGSGILSRFFPDLGSQIPNHTFESLMKIFK